jgi:Holliday junction resolvase-like predicted endonuclease
MRTAAQQIGADAEELVARRLLEAGWTILGRNVHVGRAEIDILAIDPGTSRRRADSGRLDPDRADSGGRHPGHPELVAVEVRWRARRDFGLPEETVDRAKLGRLRAAALALREGAPLTGILVPRLPLRIDLVAVEPRGHLRHHRHVG